MLEKSIFNTRLAALMLSVFLFVALLGDSVMAHPEKYVKQTDFVEKSGQTINAELNQEFNNIGAILNAIITNLILIQRDDTELGNNTVHPESLRADVVRLLSLFNPRGEWSAGTAYEKGDYISRGDYSYAIVVDHTSTASFDNDLANNLFMPISSPVTLEAVVEELYSNPTTISDFQALFDIIEQVYAISAEIVAVNANENNINIVASNIPNLNLVGNDIDNVNFVGNDIDNINALAAIESDLQNLSDNLSSILNTISGLTMVNKKLTLSLGGSEVVGSVYTTLYDAVVYGRSQLQQGGTLTVNVPTGTFNETQALPVIDDINVVLVGSGRDTSIIQWNSSFYVPMTFSDGSNLTSSNLTLEHLSTSTTTLISITNGSRYTGNGTRFKFRYGGAAGAFKCTNGSKMSIGLSSIIESNRPTGMPVVFQISGSGSHLTISAQVDVLGTGSSQFIAIINDFATADILGITVNYTDSGMDGRGVSVDDYVRVLMKTGFTFSGGSGTNTETNIPVDTYGQHYSRIITVE